MENTIDLGKDNIEVLIGLSTSQLCCHITHLNVETKQFHSQSTSPPTQEDTREEMQYLNTQL